MSDKHEPASVPEQHFVMNFAEVTQGSQRIRVDTSHFVPPLADFLGDKESLLLKVAEQLAANVSRMQLKPDEVLVFQGPDVPQNMAAGLLNAFRNAAKDFGHDNLVVFLPPNWTLALLNEEQMRRYGWVRAEIDSGDCDVPVAEYRPPSKQTQVMPTSEAPTPSIQEKCAEIRKKLEAKKNQGAGI